MPESVSLAEFLALPSESATATRALVTGLADVDASEFSGVRYQAPAGYQVRELRGSRMRTVAGLFDEFAAALQFPYYFRPNKDAFDDCMFDLESSLGDAPGYVIAVREAEQLLAEVPEERDWFDSVLGDCAEFYAGRGIAFRVLLQGGVDGLSGVLVRL